MTTPLLKSPETLKNSTIAFIGGGNMASSLIGGLINAGCDATKIYVSEPDETQMNKLCSTYHIQPCSDNEQGLKLATLVVFAVKPQLIQEISQEISNTMQQCKPLLISIAAGVRESHIQKWLGGNIPIVRTMPNTPALIQTGATGLYANDFVEPYQKELAESVMRAVGITHWVNEEQHLDSITAISGSGPAYFFYFMEAIQKKAISLGLSPEGARLLTLQTAFGAAKLAMESVEDCHVLRERVTSPGGTTEKAINSFEEAGLQEIIDNAINAAYERSVELGEIYGGEQ